MSWYYAKNDQKNGPISDSEFDTLVQQGIITPDTLVWRDGMTNWQPLRDVRAAESGAATSPLAAGAAGTCSICGKPFPAGSLITLQGRAICPDCKPLALQQIQEGVTPDAFAAERTGPAWEQRKSLGFFKALWETIKAVIQKPGVTFATMKRDGGLGTPMLFFVIMYTFGMGATYFYQICLGLLGVFNDKKTSVVGVLHENHVSNGLIIGGFLLAVIFIVPILAVVGSLIGAGIYHLFLKLFGGARYPFETTYRVFCYAQAIYIFALIPICGASVAGIWILVVVIIGLAKAHETTTGKAVGAVLVPFIACCTIAVVAVLAGAAVPAFIKAKERAQQQIQQQHHTSEVIQSVPISHTSPTR